MYLSACAVSINAQRTYYLGALKHSESKVMLEGFFEMAFICVHCAIAVPAEIVGSGQTQYRFPLV